MKITHAAAALVLGLALTLTHVSKLQAQMIGPIPPATMPATAPSTAPATPATTPAATLDGCDKDYVKGEYAAAAEGYKNLLSKSPLAAAMGMAQCLSIQGKYTEAMDALNGAKDAGAKDAAWHVQMAELLTTLGKYTEALDHATQANTLRPDWAPGIYCRGQALETLGKKDEAKAVYKTMSLTLKNDAWKKDPRSLVALGLLMTRDCVLGGKKASEQAQNILQNYIQEAYLNVDKTYWPANVAAANFLLNYHRPNQARSELTIANKINPKCPDVFVCAGAAALGEWKFEDVLMLADKALAINPKNADALLLKAQCMMQWRKFDEVESIVNKVFEVNPNQLDALCLMAALHVRQGHTDKAKPFMDKVLAVNPKSSALPGTIADWLSSGRQFNEALPYYKQAIDLAPELADPKAGLGLMYMQMGEEAKAKEILDKAYEIDDFREDVVNYRKLVNDLLDPKKYLVRETPHFVVKVDAELDSVMLDQVADYMEEIYPIICSDYGYQLPIKTYIEVFPDGPLFSVRISGKGWVPTVGACTGNVIALAAPGKDRTNSMTYNWAVVLRHEFTHAVTLTATGNRIPHWFTEACAVFQQPDKHAMQYINLLVMATKSNKLFSVKDCDWGFIRPKGPNDRQLAYAQAEWMLEYIIEKKGYNPTVANLIKGFADGLTQKEVWQKVLGVTEEEFDKDFQAWAKVQIKQWGFDPEPPPDLAKAQEAAKANPGDAAAQANLSLAFYMARNAKGAEDAARKALEIDPDQTRALGVLASILMVQKKSDEALVVAKHLEELDHSSTIAPRVMADINLEKRNWPDAIADLELLRQRQPLDQYAYQQLGEIYTKLGNPEKALPNLLELHRRSMSDANFARRIADMYMALSQDAKAANDDAKMQSMDAKALDFYHQVTYIDPFIPSTYEKMAALHLKAKRYKDAVTAAEDMVMVDPDNAGVYLKCAMVMYHAAQKTQDKALMTRAQDKAKTAVEKDKDNENSQAKEILQRIEEALKGMTN